MAIGCTSDGQDSPLLMCATVQTAAVEAFHPLDIRALDHFVMARASTISLAERGLL